MKDAEILLGSRIAVYWPNDEKFYEGSVSNQQINGNGYHVYVEYDDGDKEWIDLRNTQYFMTCEKYREISLLGSRIAVYCSDHELFYEGRVSSTTHEFHHVYVEYDNGEKDWVDLQNTKYCLISENNANIPRGSRISVYWSDDDVFYDGCVTEQKKNGHHVHVEYDDGDKEWVNLQRTQHYFLSKDVKLDDAKKKQCSKIVNVSVGSRVSIYWPAENEYFDGIVTNICTDKMSTKPYYIEYDDGDKERINLNCRKFVLLHDH